MEPCCDKDMDDWVSPFLKIARDRQRREIIERVACIMVPRELFLSIEGAPGEAPKYYKMPSWQLAQTPSGMFGIRLKDSVTLFLDQNVWPKEAVFCHSWQTPEGTIRTVKLASREPNPPKDSLRFLAAKALVRAWDSYDKDSQEFICETVQGNTHLQPNIRPTE